MQTRSSHTTCNGVLHITWTVDLHTSLSYLLATPIISYWMIVIEYSMHHTKRTLREFPNWSVLFYHSIRYQRRFCDVRKALLKTTVLQATPSISRVESWPRGVAKTSTLYKLYRPSMGQTNPDWVLFRRLWFRFTRWQSVSHTCCRSIRRSEHDECRACYCGSTR